MGSVSKHQKTNDRISNLPTNLIGHILSFLPTKDAVRTSTLSTYWNKKWALVTHLDFDDSSVTNKSMSRAKFVHFVYRVLLIKVRQLELFRLKCHRDYGAEHVNSWLFAALSRNVREVDLMIPILHDGNHLHADGLFSSRTLVILKLGEGFLLRVPRLISLVSLKILHIDSVNFDDSESLSRLVSGCPDLEELRLRRILREWVNVVNISSPVLKRLILSDLRFSRYSDTFCEVVLNTPCLEYLEHGNMGLICELMLDGYHIETLHCLDSARLNLHLIHQKEKIYLENPMLAYPMERLALAISNVRSLYLSDFTLQAFCRFDLDKARLPKFPRLIELKIDAFDSEPYLAVDALTEFLESAPQLASLSFELTEWRGFEDWHPPINVPFCMIYNLTVIKVNFIDYLEMKHLGVVKYFLNHTNSLREFIISRMEEDEDATLIEDILTLPRASQSCKIVIT